MTSDRGALGPPHHDAHAPAATDTPAQSSPPAPVVDVALSEEPLSLDRVTGFVARPEVGGVVTFTGLVRDHANGRGVTSLDYSAHPLAPARLRTLADDVANRDGVVAVAAQHRIGHLVVGDTAVVLAVGAHHRGQAFDACRELIDRLKAEVPVWKHQVFDDGDDEWVGTP